MNRIKVVFVVCLILCGFGTARAFGQRAVRNRVTISCTCDDATGQAYVTALHEALAKSSHYREVGLNEGVERNAIRISIVSLPLEEDTNGKSRSALSIVCLHDGAIIHQFVETCTKIPLKDCAESMLTDLLNWEAS